MNQPMLHTSQLLHRLAGRPLAVTFAARLSLLALMALPLLLAGCGSSGPARSDSYYRLDLSSSATKASQQYPGTVLVSKLDGRGFAADRAMIFRDTGKQDQVQRYTYHLWAESPPLSMQDLLARYLREADIAEYVVTPTQRVRADLIISGTLFRIEHRPYDSPPNVIVELELGVVRADRREPLLLKRYHNSQTASNDQINSAIPAFNRAITDIFSEFLSDLETAITTLDTAPAGR